MRIHLLFIFAAFLLSCSSVQNSNEADYSTCTILQPDEYAPQYNISIDSLFQTDCLEVYYHYSGCDSVYVKPVMVEYLNFPNSIQLHQPFAGDCEKLIFGISKIDIPVIFRGMHFEIDSDDPSVILVHSN